LAQESEQTITLIAQNQRRQVSFIAGQFISYKTLVSKNFKNGRLTEITDSTVSLEHKDHKIEKVFLKELTAFKLKGTDALIDLKRPMTGYNLDKVSIKLISGKKISGKLISTKSDSLVMQVQGKKPSIKKGYAEIESVGLHKRGSGGIGALIGGILGGGIGALIGVASRPSDDPTGLGGLSVPAGAILGFLVGTPIGAAVGSSNKQYLIEGDEEKFRSLSEKINKTLWTLTVSKGPSKN
jgi:hypothetical protein